METIKILLVDDHFIIRDGIKFMLNKHSEFEVVAEASTGIEAINYLSNNLNSVDVILMDIRMPDMDGIEATATITDRFKNIKILALTMHVDETDITNMIKAGASGYILKEVGTQELVKAIGTVGRGEKYYSNEVSTVIISSLMDQDNSKGVSLSDREIEVLSCISYGDTNKMAGEKLFISPRTVETHKRNIFTKLDVKNTAGMIKYAIENNLVD